VPQELMSHLNVSNEEASAIADYLLGLTAKNVESKPGKSSASVSGEHKYKHYVNEEFKYSIEYPSDELQVDSRVKSGTGLILNSADQKTFMHTDIDPPFHFEDGHKLTLDEVFKDALTEGSKVLRKEKGDNWFIVARAGTKFDPRYAFKKVLFGKTVKEAVMIKTFEIVYPQSKSSQYESMIKHISDSFRNLP
jgi:hypothetical protein